MLCIVTSPNFAKDVGQNINIIMCGFLEVFFFVWVYKKLCISCKIISKIYCFVDVKTFYFGFFCYFS